MSFLIQGGRVFNISNPIYFPFRYGTVYKKSVGFMKSSVYQNLEFLQKGFKIMK